MSQVRIDKAEFEAWADGKGVQYAACTVITGSLRQRLEFWIYLNGAYMVKLGHGGALYEGTDFDAAAKAFNEAAGS